MIQHWVRLSASLTFNLDAYDVTFGFRPPAGSRLDSLVTEDRSGGGRLAISYQNLAQSS